VTTDDKAWNYGLVHGDFRPKKRRYMRCNIQCWYVQPLQYQKL
jgi:hypothetical protein